MINLGKKSSMKSRGFTIIELLMVTIVIGILASIGAISYGDYQRSLIVSQLKSNLNGISTVMENARTFNNSYVSDISTVTTLTNFTAGSNATLTDGVMTLSGGSYDGGKTYCIDSSSSKDTSLHYYIDSVSALQGAQLGTCSNAHPAPNNLIATTISNTSLTASWDAVPGATSYTLQRDTNSAFPSPVIISQAGISSNATGLTQGINYYYRVNATTSSMTSGWSETISANTNISAPTIPVLAVTLNAGNVLATATPASTCSIGTPQYGFRSRTNDGTWGSYSVWSLTPSASQPAVEGVKFGYQAQARCYVDASLFGTSSTGVEATYIHPITSTPATPTVATSVPNWSTTTYSWNVTACAAGSSTRYQYYFSTSYGYNSGWVAIATNTINLTTSTAGYTYTLQVQAQCYSSYSTGGPWSASGSGSYYRPYTVTTLIVGGGGGGGGGDSYGNGGGGGAGGVIYTSYDVSPQSYGVTVGGGGCGCACSTTGGGTNGGNSGWGPYVAIGGGGGGGGSSNQSGKSGGCGGGASGSASNARGGASGTSGQGYGGGNSCSDDSRGSGGGGGASGPGGANAGCSNNGTSGGPGVTYDISGVSTQYAGGGGGGVGSGSVGNGQFGGGNGNSSMQGHNASGNTGGGGGGGQCTGSSGEGTALGGSGIIVIRYPSGSMSATGGTMSTSGSDTIHKFTSSGTFTVY